MLKLNAEEKQMQREYNNKYYLDHKEKCNNYQKEYMKAHPLKALEYRKNYYAKKVKEFKAKELEEKNMAQTKAE